MAKIYLDEAGRRVAEPSGWRFMLAFLIVAPAAAGAVSILVVALGTSLASRGDSELGVLTLLLPLAGAVLGLFFGWAPALLTALFASLIWPLGGTRPYVAACAAAGALLSGVCLFATGAALRTQLPTLHVSHWFAGGLFALAGLMGGATGGWFTRPPRICRHARR